MIAFSRLRRDGNFFLNGRDVADGYRHPANDRSKISSIPGRVRVPASQRRRDKGTKGRVSVRREWVRRRATRSPSFVLHRRGLIEFYRGNSLVSLRRHRGNDVDRASRGINRRPRIRRHARTVEKVAGILINATRCFESLVIVYFGEPRARTKWRGAPAEGGKGRSEAASSPPTHRRRPGRLPAAAAVAAHAALASNAAGARCKRKTISRIIIPALPAITDRRILTGVTLMLRTESFETLGQD